MTPLEAKIAAEEQWIAEMVACALSGHCRFPDNHKSGINRALKRLKQLRKAKRNERKKVQVQRPGASVHP